MRAGKKGERERDYLIEETLICLSRSSRIVVYYSGVVLHLCSFKKKTSELNLI